MSKTLKIGKCQVQLLPLSLTILAFVFLLSLGFWQIARLQEKELFLSSMKNNLNNPPIDIKTLSADKLYAKVKMKGHFLAGKNLHLYGRKSMSTEKDGYYLVSPFQTDDNKIILVALGWFAGRYKKNINDIVDGSTEITGVILPGEKTKLFVLNNDVKNNVWFTLDLTQASDILGLKLEDFYLIMEGNNNRSDILKSLSIKNLLNVRNDHLEYAVTWFALAISLAVIFVIYHLPKKK
ncbi:SURF1 family protein [Candidatus Tisiphia endosymbiont of Hybos culiciformis]|uniref:SURF1 family protein n=1 Tax=Candidatus Tisiphia endosymbiont of Hybos culiciformis TaxID=3139331 RepID=UPI003CCAFE7E